jgi:hypothetical protein
LTFASRHDLDALGFAARDEFVDLAERARRIRRLAMIDRAQHQIGGALQRRAIRRHAGRYARFADEAAVSLRKFVVAIAAQGQERGAVSHFVFTRVQAAQERTATVELAAEAFVPYVDAVVGNAAQHGVADVSAAAVLDIIADRIAAARIADQRYPCRTRPALQFLDGVGELAALVFGRRAVGLLHLVIGPRQGIGKIDRKHPLARHAVGFHPPQRSDPQRRVIAIAMHEQDRRHFRGGGRSRRGLRKSLESKGAGQQRQHARAFQDQSPR